MFEKLKKENKTIGIKQSIKAVEGETVEVVYIAEDAEERITKDLKNICKEKGIEIIYVDTMKQLGKACGIDVGAAAACILK